MLLPRGLRGKEYDCRVSEYGNGSGRDGEDHRLCTAKAPINKPGLGIFMRIFSSLVAAGLAPPTAAGAQQAARRVHSSHGRGADFHCRRRGLTKQAGIPLNMAAFESGPK
jgi:hypothetical protein